VTADRPELQRARQWSSAFAAALDEVTAQVDAAARRVADGWPDARGRDWTERLVLLGHALDRDAADAHGLGRAVDRVAEVADGAPPALGPLLGGTGGRHADDRRGVTIPQLGHPFSG
jgi:hypothetical protein